MTINAEVVQSATIKIAVSKSSRKLELERYELVIGSLNRAIAINDLSSVYTVSQELSQIARRLSILEQEIATAENWISTIEAINNME